MLPELHAERQLAQIEAASVPHMTADGHRQTIDKYLRLTGGETRPPRATPEMLRALGIPVTEVPKKVKTDG